MQIQATKPQPQPVILQCCLVLLFIAWQVAFFCIHYHVSDLMDSLANASIAHEFFSTVILLPIIAYIFTQIICYVLIILYANFITTHLSTAFNVSQGMHYGLSLFCLALALLDLLAFNSYYFPFSFFAFSIAPAFLLLSGLFWLVTSLIAYVHFFKHTPRHLLGWVFISLATINVFCALPSFNSTPTSSTQPNIILIGLDSLRPDFAGFYGNQTIHTPHIDQFLNQSTAFDHSYTPLARTFTAWMSILTAQYPKHDGIRNNLADQSTVINKGSLAKTLQQAGYYTVYASDEKRFSNILPQNGFNKIAGPSMGVNDFILGSLSDFPLANLLTKLPIARYLLPYNYGNRAAAVTYQPDQFVSLVSNALSQRPGKPLFLAVHLCLSHWPFTWASALGRNETLPNQYKHSVEAIDEQFGQMLALLEKNKLLNNSIVVLLSDHGTALGLQDDTLLNQKNYQGNKALLSNIPVTRLSNAAPDSVDFKHDYSTSTAYGQGTNVSSLKQYHTLLAFKGYGQQHFPTQRIETPVSLTDITPTLLSVLKLPPLKKADGVSLAGGLQGHAQANIAARAFFLETGDSLSEVETDHIYLEKVVAKKIGIYQMNPDTGLLVMDPIAEKAIIANKQRAVMWGDWLLAHYPASIHNKLVFATSSSVEAKIEPITVPAYYVLINMRTKKWTIGLSTPFAKTAPVALLQKKLKDFYGSEL